VARQRDKPVTLPEAIQKLQLSIIYSAQYQATLQKEYTELIRQIYTPHSPEFPSLEEIFKEVANWLIERIKEIYTGLANWFSDAISELYSYFYGAVTTIYENVYIWIWSISDWFRLTLIPTVTGSPQRLPIKKEEVPLIHFDITWLVGIVMDTFRDLIEYPPPVTADKAWNAAKNYATLAAILGSIKAWGSLIDSWISRILSTKIFGTGVGGEGGSSGRPTVLPIVESLSTLYWALGFCWLTWSIFGGAIRATIGDPLENYYREKYRTREITRTMVDEWFRSGAISEERAKQLYAKLGYADEYIPLIMQAAYIYLSPSVVLDAYKYKLRDRGWAVNYLKKRGYRPEDAELYVSIFEAEQLEKQLKELKELSLSAIRSLYLRGLLDRDMAIAKLKALKYREDDIKLLLELWDQEAEKPEKDKPKALTYSQIRALFIREIISEDEARAYLTDLKYPENEIDLLIKLWKNEKERYEEPAYRTLPYSIIRSLFIRGIIDEVAARSKLALLNYTPEDINAIIDLWKNEKLKAEEPRIRELSYSVIHQLWLQNIITDDQAIARLTALNYRPEDASLIVNLWKKLRESPREEKVRTLTLSILRRLYFRDLITRDDLEQELLLMDYTQDRVNKIISLWDSEKSEWLAGRVRKLPFSVIRSLFLRGIFGRPQAKEYLRKLGYSETDADLIIDLWLNEKVKREEPHIRPLTLSTIRGLWMNNIITDDQALSLLSDLNYAPDKASLILALWKYQKFNREEPQYRVLSYSVIRAMYVRRIIDEKAARKYLGDLRYRPELIDLIIELWNDEIRRYEEPRYRTFTRSEIYQLYNYGLIDYEELSDYLSMIGIDPTVTPIISELYKRRKLEDELRMWRRTALRIYARGFYDKEWLRNELLATGLSPDEVDIVIHVYELEDHLDSLEESVRIYREAFRKGIIDESELRARLQDLKLRPDKIERIVALETLRREA